MAVVKIYLDNSPEFYTNLDEVTGRVVLTLERTEQISAVTVKLEGESKTALVTSVDPYDPQGISPRAIPMRPSPGSIVGENHKILYRIQQLFPDPATTSTHSSTYWFEPGHYEYPFRFRLPFNNACSDSAAMSRMGGLSGLGGFGSGSGLFGGGIRVMDGSKQLFLQHVKRTLPPSLTGFPEEAEIRYYAKVTVQRPGILRENWRYQIGFKFMPIEPPRPPPSPSQAFARRPFTFRLPPPGDRKRVSRNPFFNDSDRSHGAPALSSDIVPPCIEISALLPHPAILTCNKPIPLTLVAKKKTASREMVHLTSLQIDLVGSTRIRCHDLSRVEQSRWIVVSRPKLQVPVVQTSDDSEIVLPKDLWHTRALPNTVHPSFVACNLSRSYALEIRIGLTWTLEERGFRPSPQLIRLPLTFTDVQVFSGIAPSPEVLSEMRRIQASSHVESTATSSVSSHIPPAVPPRPVVASMSESYSTAATSPVQPHPLPSRVSPVATATQTYDPLYPPQLGAPGSPPYDDAPPSYDEAIADRVAGPFDGQGTRPAYSGVTNDVNGPSQIPGQASANG